MNFPKAQKLLNCSIAGTSTLLVAPLNLHTGCPTKNSTNFGATIGQFVG